jgi:microcystin-dependent protein
MSEAFVAEIRIVGFNFAPTGWALCDGQLMSISQNTALFSLLGTTYGGDGRTTFGLPNLQGCSPMHQGQGSGLSDRSLGESGGSPAVTLLVSEMPAHAHTVSAGVGSGNQVSPTGRVWSSLPGRTPPNLYATTSNIMMRDAGAFSIAGGGQPHNNMSPYLVLNFIIAMQGIYPSRP